MHNILLTVGAVAALSGCTSTASQVCTAEFPGALCLDTSAAGGLLAHQALIEEEVGGSLERLFGDSDWPDLEAVIRSELSPTLAHEIHHAMRRRAIGYGSTLLQAVVSEGLADQFSIEVSPDYDPPWTRALTEEELAIWIPEVLARSTGSYSHPEWFFGSGSVPYWTGYAVGFELVRLFLEGHPDHRASTLVGEPETSFVPATP